MSIRFEDEPTPEVIKMMMKSLGEPDEASDREFLYKNLPDPISVELMSRIARAAGQPMTLTLYSVGDEITLSDRRVFRCVEDGWQFVGRREFLTGSPSMVRPK